MKFKDDNYKYDDEDGVHESNEKKKEEEEVGNEKGY